MLELGQRTTTGKALNINLDPLRYGTFAEIGAGQEVARYFFQAGKASQTIAKTISAYDMIYSDEIYGKEKSGRYVCESRLIKMLEKEYGLLIRRLQSARGDKTAFFAFANTVSTNTAQGRQPHGWMGVRFQTKPGGEFNDIVLHVRMLDRNRLLQQECLGVLGVNLCSSAFYHREDPQEFLQYLVDNIKSEQISIDLIRFKGPELKKFNDREMNLSLIKAGFNDAALFSPSGEILTISDAIYNKEIIVQRGHFRPVTLTHIDVLQKGIAQFQSDAQKAKQKIDLMPIMEITMNEDGVVPDIEDFSARVRLINELGFHVLVSRFYHFYQMKNYLRKYTNKSLAVVMGAVHLENIFSAKTYHDLEGGILEGLGKLLERDSRLYIYPHKTAKSCLTAGSFFPKGEMAHLFKYFREQNVLSDISGCDEIEVYYRSTDVYRMIQEGDKAWEKMCHPKVVECIKKEKCFGLSKKKK